MCSQQLLETLAVHVGRQVCVCLCRGRGVPGLLGPSETEGQQINFYKCACMWYPWYPPLIHPSEAGLGLCWGTGDMWRPGVVSTLQEPLFCVGKIVCAGC